MKNLNPLIPVGIVITYFTTSVRGSVLYKYYFYLL